MTDDTAFISATTLLDLYRRRELSPVEVARAALDRIAALQPVLNAFCLVEEATTLAAAREAEARWQRGEPKGALDGVPVSIKDIVVTRGWPTLRGSRAIDPNQPWQDDAPVVARLREAGAVPLGKTATSEFAWKATTDSSLCGFTRNPWNPALTPGGSSGGAGAAIAAGLGPLAVGTDAGGSIRIPASLCGVFGFKPSFGRVPTWPPTPFGTFASVGSLTRTVEDTALMLNVATRFDARDWSALPPDGRDYRGELDAGIAGLRVAWSPTLGYARVDPETAALCASAVTVFAELGATVEEVDPGFEDPVSLMNTLWAALAAVAFEKLRPEQLAIIEPSLVEAIEAGRRVNLLDYLRADMARTELGIRMKRFHERFDLLVTPTLATPAFPVERSGPEGWDGPPTRWFPFTYPFNLTRQPAASLPCGWTVSGLPIGLQVIAAPHADHLVLRAAHAFEQARPWADRRPPVVMR